MGTILVATDGSDSAKKAADLACALARKSGDGLLLVTAWREVRGAFGSPLELLIPELAGLGRDWATEMLDEACKQAQAAGVTVSTARRHGRPAHEICKVARERGVRMIVLGSHGWGPVEGVLLGSVAEAVLHDAPCPVLVAPAVASTAGTRADTAGAAVPRTP